MLYLKVIPIFDQTILYAKKGNNFIYFTTLFANELYTEKEWNKIREKSGECVDNFVQKIQVKKSEIFRSCGVRFQMHENSERKV